MAQIRVERQIAADPTSTALLLAGPAALELWPGVRRVGGDTRVAHAEAVLREPLPQRTALVEVRTLPPRRTPTAYVTEFEFSGDGVPVTTGVVTLGYTVRGDGHTATTAELRLDCADDSFAAPALRRTAARFLANLAAAAEQRSYAA